MPIYDINASGTQTPITAVSDISSTGTQTSIVLVSDINVSGSANIVFSAVPPYLFNNGSWTSKITTTGSNPTLTRNNLSSFSISSSLIKAVWEISDLGGSTASQTGYINNIDFTYIKSCGIEVRARVSGSAHNKYCQAGVRIGSLGWQTKQTTTTTGDYTTGYSTLTFNTTNLTGAQRIDVRVLLYGQNAGAWGVHGEVEIRKITSS